MRLKRKKRVKRIVPRLLIVCEGKVTEFIYFDGIRRFRRIPRELVTLDRGSGVPLSLVERAIILKQKNREDAAKDSYLLFDQIWCVFDRDEHPNIPEAKQLAQKHNIKVAFSNPNFELFLLLHCVDCNKNLHRDKVRALLKKYHPEYDKSFNYMKFHDSYPAAKSRATEINKRSTVVSFIESAPFCSVHKLVDILRRGI